ncbi:GGDEF domain-containing response regulator [Arenimonas terrae]|uniref:Response regulator n=1 Tax=Arenimonas terrae TaxID=2546226 RepID=A0A5C4RV63_9GAMM|nr:response regulator [Arenimonas terrae]TNJ34789.1 response regulator [Arenimonas terrae]
MGGESGARARILVVDDSKLMRKAALKMLGDEFDVITADDGVDAWALLEQDASIRVVFTDLNMPRLDGYELLKRVRGAEDPGVQGLPVIVVTGAENDEAARMQALDTGATDFITKPFTTSDLVARARAHATHQRVTRALQAQSMLDSLTGLANKAGLLDRLQQDIAYARRHNQPLSLVRLELEDFRRFFLYYGRELADALVLQVARLVRARIRKEDTAARIGLGGFALSLPGGQAEGIAGMIERLRAEISAHAPRDEEGNIIEVALRAAVLAPDLSAGPGAQAVFDQCQAQLEATAVALPLPRAAPEVPPAPAVAEGAAAPVAVAAGELAATSIVAPVASEQAVESAPVTMGVPAPAAPVVAAATAAAPPAAAAVPAPAPTEPLRLDPLFDQLARGDSQPILQKLPQVITRLLPLFRLLGPNQRAQLIQFLQKLG